MGSIFGLLQRRKERFEKGISTWSVDEGDIILELLEKYSRNFGSCAAAVPNLRQFVVQFRASPFCIIGKWGCVIIKGNHFPPQNSQFDFVQNEEILFMYVECNYLFVLVFMSLLWWDTAASSLSFQPLVDLMISKTLWSRQFWKICSGNSKHFVLERDDPLCIIGLCWWCLFFHVLHSLTQRFYLLIAISHPQSRVRKRLACVVHFLWRHHIPITTNKPWETRFFEAILTFHNGQN